MVGIRARFSALLVLVALCAWSRAAAAGDKEAARAAYDRATAAFEAGDFKRAADDYALADALAPHPVALRWALRSALNADAATLGMNLVLRSERRDPTSYAKDRALQSTIMSVRRQFAPRVALLQLTCAPAHPCSAELDGRKTPLSAQYIAVGKHQLVFRVAGDEKRQSFQAAAGATLRFEAQRPQPAPAVMDQWPLVSPILPVVGAVLSAGLTAGSIASGVDVVAKNDAYLAQRTQALFDSGMAAQTRTNVLIGLTATAGVATLVLGALSLDWDGAGDGAGEPANEAKTAVWLAPVALPLGNAYFAGLHLQGSY